MNIPILGRAIDERFLTHRLRSTSIAGMLGAAVAMGLFLYRLLTEQIWSWDLLAVGLTMAAAKVALMTYYHFTD
jgi:hypothetical protein